MNDRLFEREYTHVFSSQPGDKRVSTCGKYVAKTVVLPKDNHEHWGGTMMNVTCPGCLRNVAFEYHRQVGQYREEAPGILSVLKLSREILLELRETYRDKMNFEEADKVTQVLEQFSENWKV